MNIINKNLLQRVRVVMIALVAIIGIGGIMAMKPAKQLYAYSYGVQETPNGLNWIISADATNLQAGIDYDCDNTVSKACIIHSNSALTPGEQIPKDPSLIERTGNFNQ